ncbi:Protein of unknown function [Bacillus wiedmannii]|nr:Protein of unknown function [Bacillus wiedmannii]SCM99729.1 Protein of unknown function [Bacillus cereus]
MFQKAL